MIEMLFKTSLELLMPLSYRVKSSFKTKWEILFLFLKEKCHQLPRLSIDINNYSERTQTLKTMKWVILNLCKERLTGATTSFTGITTPIK
jgi:hypothetical protein